MNDGMGVRELVNGSMAHDASDDICVEAGIGGSLDHVSQEVAHPGARCGIGEIEMGKKIHGLSVTQRRTPRIFLASNQWGEPRL